MKLFNTLTRQKEKLDTSKPIKIYSCGLTVYNQPHIGNWTGYIYWDVLVRLLRYQDVKVEVAQNITDVGHLVSDEDSGEDKMEKGARREGLTAWEVAEKYIKIADHEAYDLLNLTRPDHLERATDYIDQQIDIVRQLEEKGFTYEIPNDGIYFDTSKLKNYGELARLDIAGLKAGARVKNTGKRNITDFAVWKFSPTNAERDMEWDSPWGKGFPGWHLECTAIALNTLGEEIDIHTGGIDHIPVHHTNEIAQTDGLLGKQVVKTWIHNNHIKVDGRKMSKSLGNFYTLSDITGRGFSPMDFKLLILEKHYQTEGNFSWDILASAHNHLHNWRNYAGLRHQTHDTLDNDEEKDEIDGNLSFHAAKQAVIEALNDNLDTPQAISLIDQAFSKLDNQPLVKIHRSSLVNFLETIDELFGLKLLESTPDISDKSKQLILKRHQARDQGDWKTSDDIRNELAKERITVKDTPSGTTWQYSD